MSDWKFLERYRVTDGVMGSSKADGKNGAFQFPWRGAYYTAVCSDGKGWMHVSISRDGANRCPSWEIMCEMKDLFFEPEDTVVQFHPAKDDYVNVHPHCLHLWKWLEGEFPKPDPIMVGPKNLTVIL